MRMNAVPSLFAVAVAVTLSACGPSIDPAAKADIDRQVAALQAATNTVPPPAPGMFAPMPFAVGQWTRYKMTNDKNQPSFITYKIVGQDGNAVWLEVVNETYTGRTMQKMLVAFGNRMDPNTVEIRAVSTKDAKGRVQEMPPPVISLMQSTYRGAVSMLIINWQGLPQESASVPAGKFDGCFKARTDAQWGPWRSVADSWSHPAVPLSGAVRSQGVDHPFTMELAAFGTSGAVSEF
ncbi:MAG TPA: hypothetical protein VIF57_03190 [Polyangia bacterium]|jgi:hypothetical protein